MLVMKYNPRFYDFYKHGVTQSMITSWLECPTQCYLEYVEGWTQEKRSAEQSILFGNICHHVLYRAYSEVACPAPGIIKTYINEYSIVLTNDI